MNRHEGLGSIAAKLWRPVIGIIGLALIITWSGGMFKSRVPPGTAPHEPGQALDRNAILHTVGREKIIPRIDIVGTVTSEEKSHLSARVPAYIKAIFVSAGDAVKKGQTLLMLDDREIREQLSAAQSQFKQAEIEYKRTKGLFRQAAATEQALVAAESMYTSMRARVKQVDVMLTYAVLTSPIDGVVTDRRVEVGDLANPGQVLLTVYDPLRMRLEAPVPVRLIEKLAIHKNVEVTLERPRKTFQGTVTEIVSEVDPQSRTQLVKVRLQNLEGTVLPGIFGRLWVEEDAAAVIVIPSNAVSRVGQLEITRVVKNGRVWRRLIKTGAHMGNRVEVLSGLKEGETILLPPQVKG